MKQLNHTSKVRVVEAKGKFLQPEIMRNAVVVSDRLVRENVFASVPVFRYTEQVRCDEREALTRDVSGRTAHLDESGVAKVGAVVSQGDVLVGKIQRKKTTDKMTPEERLLQTSFGRSTDFVDTSLRYEFRDCGVVCCVYAKPDEVILDIMVRRQLQVGDELSTKDGTILTVAVILPEQDMPSFEGDRVDVLVHSESSVTPHLHRPGFLKLKGKGRRKTKGDIVRLTKRTLHGEETLSYSDWRAMRSLFTQQPIKGGLGSGVITVTREDAQAISAAGYPENVREMFSVNCDAVEAYLRVYEEVLQNGIARSETSRPESVNIMEVMLKGMCLVPEWKSGNLVIRPATSKDVASWTSGKVTSSETIHHRSLRPVPDGLFCQRIFGPDRDWECACGKYRGGTLRGMACEQCGVLIADSRVRRHRFGHIELRYPVLHYWYREYVADALSVSLEELDQMDVLEIRTLLEGKGIDPEGIVFYILPVIPPELRPIVRMEDTGQVAQTDLNEFYRRIINRNSRLAKLTDLKAPQVVINNERRMLQIAVDHLFANRLTPRPLAWGSGRLLADFRCQLENAIDRISTKRVACTVQGIPIPDGGINPGTIGVPYSAALHFLDPLVIRQLKLSGYAQTIKGSRLIMEQRPNSFEVRKAVYTAVYKRSVLALTGKRLVGVLRCIPVDGELLRIHPDDARTMNVSFDGEPLKLFATHTEKAQEELHNASPLMDTMSKFDLSVREIIRAAWNRSSIALTEFDQLLLG